MLDRHHADRPQSRRHLARALAASTVVALAASACATQPFSYLNGRRLTRAQLDTYDAMISSIDGVSRPTQHDIRVDPGPHHIVFQGPPSAFFHPGELRSLDIDIEPCTRYWFEARKPSPLMADFMPAVNAIEPIAGCHP